MSKQSAGNSRSKCQESWSYDEDMTTDRHCSGTAMIYRARGSKLYAMSGGYELDWENEWESEDMRAVRLFRASRGEKIARVPDTKLGDEFVVVFGSGITADLALRGLQALIARIKEEGLKIGRLGAGDFICDPVGKPLTVNDARSFDAEGLEE